MIPKLADPHKLLRGDTDGDVTSMGSDTDTTTHTLT